MKLLAKKNPDDGRLLFSLGKARQGMGLRAAAVEAFCAAAKVRADVPLLVQIAQGLREEKDLELAGSLLRSALEKAPDSPLLLLEFGQLARAEHDDEAAVEWFRRASAAAPDDPIALFEVARSLQHLHRTLESEALIREVEAMPGALASDRLRFLRFSHLCSDLRFDAALACLREFDSSKPLPPTAVAGAITLHAARGDWQEVLRLLREEVAMRTGPAAIRATNNVLEAIGRAARALSAQAETIELLRRWQASASPAVVNLTEQLVEELQILAVLGLSEPADDVLQTSSMRADRVIKLASFTSQRQPAPKGTIFLCTDRAYLVGTLVATSSLLRHSRAGIRNCALFVFCSEDALPLARPMFAELAAAYGILIETISVADLGRPHKGFRADWGSFSPGARLSDAAYYRILAGLWLADLGQSGRAIYLDSDVVVSSGFEDLIGFDLGGLPLGARREDPDAAHISRAARKLGLAPSIYFNSGVLLFDLAHEKTTRHLIDSLEFAMAKPELLTMLDQCALNVAFQAETTALPQSFNSFVRAKGDFVEIPADARVIHFISRPKPWDPAYNSRNNMRWLEEWAALSKVLTAEQMRILAASTMGHFDASIAGLPAAAA